jgi:transposase
VSHGYKGKGSLIHLLVDGNGQPVITTTTAANGDERREVAKLLDKTDEHFKRISASRMTILEADRGYDCAWLRQDLLIRGVFPFIPYRKTPGRIVPKTEEVMKTFCLEKKRWKVERAFAWIKRRCRRLLMRWERKAVIWNGFVTLGVVYTWIGNLVGYVLIPSVIFI